MARKARPIALMMLVLGLATVPRAAAAPTEISSCQTIFSPGSYVVTQNLSNPSADCLLLEADQVTIDLNGFVVSGAGSGIASAGGATRFLTAIRNGTVTGSANGIGLASGRATMVERVRARGGSGWAILLNEEAIVKDCIAVDGNNGIQVGGSSVVVGNIASDNSGTGILAGGTSVLRENTASHNGGHGLVAGEASTLTGNTASSNGGVGIQVTCRSAIIGNTAIGNDQGNITLTGHNCTRAHNAPHP